MPRSIGELLRELAAGREAVGNVDLYRQPSVFNPHGGRSTVNSIGVNFDGKEYLLPQVTPDGRLLTPDQAIDEFKRTGRHLGVYADEQSAARAGSRLHDQYARGDYPNPLNTLLNILAASRQR